MCKNCGGPVEEYEYVRACSCCAGELCGKCCAVTFAPRERPTLAELERGQREARS